MPDRASAASMQCSLGKPKKNVNWYRTAQKDGVWNDWVILTTCSLLVRQSTLKKGNGSGDTKKNGGVFRFSRPRVHFPFQVISGEGFLRFVDSFLSETWLVHISEKVLPRGLSTSCAVFSVDPHGFYPRLTSTCFSLIHFIEFFIYLFNASFVHISRNAFLVFDETVCLKILAFCQLF